MARACLNVEGLVLLLLCAGKPVSEFFGRGADGADDGDGRSLISLTSAREAAPNGFVGLALSVSSSDDRSISKRWPRMIALKSMLNSHLCVMRLGSIYGCLRFLAEFGSADIQVFVAVSLHNSQTKY